MPKYSEDTIPICVKCDNANAIKTCKKCHINYCKHYASATDIRFCGNCVSDIKLRETILEKTVEHENPDGTISFSRKYQARRLVLQGNDWLFTSHLIADMPDDEIDGSVEYHRAYVDLLLQEKDSRKLERYKKLRGMNIVINGNATQQKSNRKIKTKEKDPNQQLLDAIMLLTKSGMKPEAIASLLKGKK